MEEVILSSHCLSQSLRLFYNLNPKVLLLLLKEWPCALSTPAPLLLTVCLPNSPHLCPHSQTYPALLLSVWYLYCTPSHHLLLAAKSFLPAREGDRRLGIPIGPGDSPRQDHQPHLFTPQTTFLPQSRIAAGLELSVSNIHIPGSQNVGHHSRTRA